MPGQPSNNTIYTIGHSTHSLDEFLEMLKSFHIETIADIRSLPGSRRFQQFNKEELEISLPKNGIEYLHLADLGGRRKVKKDSINNRWNNDSFKGYADYMEAEQFKSAILSLEALASKKRVAYMCSEAVWCRCHRSMVSDYLKSKDWNVVHIMGVEKSQPHRYTAPARIVDGRLLYSDT